MGGLYSVQYPAPERCYREVVYCSTAQSSSTKYHLIKILQRFEKLHKGRDHQFAEKQLAKNNFIIVPFSFEVHSLSFILRQYLRTTYKSTLLYSLFVKLNTKLHVQTTTM